MNNDRLYNNIIIAKKESFLAVMIKFGFETAYEIILSQMNSTERKNILADVLESLSIMNTKDLSKYQSQKSLTKIINSNIIEDKLKVYIVHQHFINISSNYIIKKQFQDKKIEEMLLSLCNFYLIDSKFDEVHKESLLYFYKRFVLLNPNKNRRNHLFDILVKALQVENEYIKKNSFIETIAELFLSLYIYSFYESNTIKPEHSKQLKDLLKFNSSSISTSRISLARMIEQNIQMVINYYVKSLFSNNIHNWLFDYYPEGSGVRHGEIPVQRNIRIIIALSSLFGHHVDIINDFKQFYNKKLKISESHLNQVCLSALTCFNKATQELDVKTTEERARLSEFFRKSSKVSQTNLYKYFNSIRKQYLYQETSCNTNQVNIDDATSIIQAILAKDAGKEYNSHLEFSESSKMYLAPTIKHRQFSSGKILVQTFTNHMQTYIWQIFNKLLPEHKISFTAQGLSELSNLIRKYKIQITNYAIDYELGFSHKVKESNEYKELKNQLSELSFKKIYGTNNVFLGVENFEFNFEISDFKCRQLNDEEAEKWISSNKIAEGIYEVDFTTMSYNEVKEYAERYMIVETVYFNLAVNIDETSGFRINYRFN